MLYKDYMPNRNSKTLLETSVTTDTFVDVVSLTTDNLIAGTYQFVVSFVASNPDTNDSLYWRVIGDRPSPVFIEESKDISDVEPDSYTFQFDHPGGAMNHTLQMRKEDIAATTIDVIAAGIYVTRV